MAKSRIQLTDELCGFFGAIYCSRVPVAASIAVGPGNDPPSSFIALPKRLGEAGNRTGVRVRNLVSVTS